MLRKRFHEEWSVGPFESMSDTMSGGKRKTENVTLPHDCMIVSKRRPDAASGAANAFYPGITRTYKKQFLAPGEWEDKYVVFEFEGAYTNAMVYINGDYAGGCPHGYSCFRVEAGKFLKYGQENEISVNVRTARDSRWYSGAGLYRNVYIMISELVYFVPGSYRVTTPEVDEQGARVTIDYVLENRGHVNVATEVLSIIRDAGGQEAGRTAAEVTLYPGEKQVCRQSLYLSEVNRWDIDSPYLYQAESGLRAGRTLDTERTTFGIRTLQLDPVHGLRINGRETKLRGACIHHDNGMLGTATFERAEERRAELLKKAGFNAIRSAHNPISTAFLDACDRIGLVVMDEVSDMWTRPKTPEDFSAVFPYHWEEVCQSLVEKDYNHPSVVFYSIGNEIPETGTSHGAATGRKLTDKIRKLDHTRYVLNSINVVLAVMDKLVRESDDGEGQEINEFMNNLGDAMSEMVNSEIVTKSIKESCDCVDLAGYNYAAARYQTDRKLFPDRVLVGSETAPKEIADNWDKVMRYANVIGDFTWTGWDYLGEAGIGKMEYKEDGAVPGFCGVYPWLLGYCGDLDITGGRRPVSYYREIVFGLRQEPYIAAEYPKNFGKTLYTGMWDFIDGISSWSFRGYEGRPVRVYVFGRGDSFKLYLNGEERAAGRLEKFRGDAVLTYEPGELKAVTYLSGKETGTFVLHSAGDGHHLEVKADRDELRADNTDLSYVDIAICDEKGIVDNMADRLIKASATGAGELKALGSADPKTTESFHSGMHTSFNGKAQAIIRPLKAGLITLRVEAEGLEPVEIRMTAK